MSYEEKASKRIIEMFTELGEESQRKVLDHIKYQDILQAAREVNKTRTVCFGDLYADVLDRRRYFNQFEGYRTGLKYFDDALMGLRGGELVIVAGPSNYGKTMVALNIGVSTIVRSHKKVLVVSMEMPARHIADRAFQMTDDHNAMMEGLIIQTELKVSPTHIAAMIERDKPDLVILDHIQFLANQESSVKEYERITAATAKLKRLAIEYDIPVIAVSHVAKTRSGSQGEATANDLKGSSSIEQDCDVGFMINRVAGQQVGDQIEVTLFKHRNKRPAIFHKACALRFDGVRLADAAAYTYDGDTRQQQRVAVPAGW